MATADFSVAQKFKIAAWYENFKSPVMVHRKFRSEYGRNASLPDPRTIKNLHANCIEHGTVIYKSKGGRKRESRSLENIANVEDKIEENPRISIRRLACSLELSRATVHRILQEKKYHPYKIKVVQELFEEDLAARVQFCEDFLELLESEPEILKLILFTDEANFHINGAVNRHNCRYWATEDPKELHAVPLHSPKVVVWGGIWSGGVVGPFFFNGSVNKDSYRAMLQDYLVPLLEETGEMDEIYFMQDGAAPHFAKTVRSFLSDTFPARVIGRGCDIPWPPRSPDLTPCDFFLWGYIKNLVYSEPVHDIEHLKERIRHAFTEVTGEMRAKTLLNFKFRLEKCIEREGAHVE